MAKPKIAITGSQGLLGKTVTDYFSSLEDYKVIELARGLGLDFTNETLVKSCFAQHAPDYLVNLFAYCDPVESAKERTTLFDISLDSFRKYLDVNVTALFSVCREFAQNPEAKSIVNFSSIYGVVSPLPFLYGGGEKHIGYSVSKGAVIQLSRHLAVHLAPRVRVNTVVLGGVEDRQGDDFVRAYSRQTPMGRMMQRHELNKLLQFLCSENSSYITGSTITVDGGWTAW
ncbi:MAG: SDR family oxidoreductase [Planctomycetes bacterium]|nr:SDR family oxidoreductase [Planctomycetota bacterium]